MQQMDDKKALEIWKSKSLNSMPTETYKISQKPSSFEDLQSPSKKKGDRKKQPTVKTMKEVISSATIPEPKITKINQAIFCIYLYNQLNIFKYFTDKQKTIKKNKSLSFNQITKILSSNIMFVMGFGNQHIYVGLKHQLIVYELAKKKRKDQESGNYDQFVDDIRQIARMDIQNLKQVTITHQKNGNNYLIVISSDKLYKYSIAQQYKLVKETKIYFWISEDHVVFSQMQSISLLPDKSTNLYFFGVIKEEKDRLDDKSETIEKQQCETLFLVNFVLEGTQIGDSVSGKVSQIDHIFQKGIFGKSKVYKLGKAIFLMSLHEETVVIKENFDKYVVWDNISLAPSKSNEKKGQLVLANKIVMVYTQMGEIYAQNIVFAEEDGQYKLKTPRIDSFRGNDDDQAILYDALVLQYQLGSFMKVLFYFKKDSVFDPSNPNATPVVKEEKTQDKNKILVTILCIRQDNPVKKLGELFRSMKNPHQITEFVQRFHIDDLEKSKCQWSVSDKTQKDIENLLLQIKNNQYIQEQLTKILKQSPHDLKFLYTIETKQINRYKKMLASKLLRMEEIVSHGNNDQSKASQAYGQFYSSKQVDYLKDIIRWLMESTMFRKKIKYSQNFLEFKEYDFIEIGKLKAASLKEEIKLLSCKGFEKRLKYFMNSFKYMTLFNFEDIFTFLIEDKNQHQVKEFFAKNFSFILPNFEEDSKIFKSKKKFSIGRGELYSSGRQECQLWIDNIDEPTQREKIETVSSFKRQMIDQINKLPLSVVGLKHEQAIDGFMQILNQFITEDWFLKNKSKQHSILTTTIEQLKDKFLYLKKIGVFHIMIRIFFQKIYKKVYKEEQVNAILLTFVEQELIPASFYANIKARRIVYNKLAPKININLPLLSEFLVFQETKYFNFLFKNYPQLLLKQIKMIYSNIEPGFFKQKFQIYLNSQEIQLKQIINFLDQFEGNVNDDIRLDVFTSIKNILRVDDIENTRSFVSKLMDKQILKTSKTNDDQLIDEAKVAFGFYFFNFFKVFDLKNTYKDLISYTYCNKFEDNKFILSLLQTYCHYISTNEDSGSEQGSHIDKMTINLDQLYGLDQIENISLSNPAQFFGVLLYMTDTLRFDIDSGVLFDEIVRLFFECAQYEQIAIFVDEINMIDDDDQQFNKSRHYLLIGEFKQNNNHDISERMAKCLIRWIRQKYMTVDIIERINQNQIEQYIDCLGQLFESINEAIKILDKLLKGKQIGRQKQFLKMLCEIRDLYPNLLFYVMPKRYEHFTPQIRANMLVRSEYSFLDDELQEKSPLLTSTQDFIFMMRLFNCIEKDRFNCSDISLINKDLVTFQKIYEHFRYASQYYDNFIGNSKTGYIRFNIQFATNLIQYDYFEYCFQVILKCINKSQCYFRDVFFHFFSNLELKNKDQNAINNFVKQFIKTEAESIMQRKIKTFILENSINSFQKDENHRKATTQIVFNSILESNRLDQAFYFLVRSKNIPITSAKYCCDGRFDKKSVLSYAVMSIYLRCLRQHLCEQFYPTFVFYKQKHAMLVNQFERKDIIKDIYIAISKMKQWTADQRNKINGIQRQLILDTGVPEDIIASLSKNMKPLQEVNKKQTKGKVQNKVDLRTQRQKIVQHCKKVQANLKELDQLYKWFMIAHNLDPELKLNQTEIKKGHEKLEQMNRLFSPQQLTNQMQGHHDNREEQSQKQRQRKQLQDKIRKTKQQSDHKYYQLNKQINDQMSQARLTKQKYQKQLQQRKLSIDKKPEEAISQYEKLKEREQFQIKSIKDSYKSQASQRVNKMIEQMRQRKDKILGKNQETSKFSVVSIPDSKDRSRQFEYNHISSPKSPSNDAYQVKLHGLDGESKHLFLPITMNKGEDKSNSKVSSKKPDSYISSLNQKKSRFGSSQNIGISHNSGVNSKQSLDELIKLFGEREPQCKKYIEKLQFVKNNLEVGVQLTKSIYQSIYNFDMFMKYLKFMVHNNSRYKEVIEEKAIQIAQQALGIEYKINLKELFPIQLFLDVTNIPIKQYYKKAYEHLRPNLMNIMKKSDINIHGLAILFRYGFGSENIYYYRVYEDYIRVLLRDYETVQFDEKKLFLLAEKLRTLYNNISPESRDNKFEHLLREVKNENKRKIIAKEILKIIERRTEMLTGQNSSDLRNVITKLA